MTIIIPARKNSKGLPFKNRKLIKHTLNTIPSEFLDDVIITTDDEIIIEEATKRKVKVIERSANLCLDDVSIRDVMEDVITKYDLEDNETIVMLYLTYPERTWKDIGSALDFYHKNKTKSLLCRKDLQFSPFLCMIESGLRGKQLTPHNFYRRQDYPKCFEISHFICVFQVGELNKLNKNMYNGDTIFYGIRNIVDVDTSEDLNTFYDKNNS
jgi:CMP-N-acetylneuraminic acid synthetase